MSTKKLLQPVRVTTAYLSCFASTLIAIVILRSHNGLKNPYSRIIFGLSIADIIQSTSIIISPFAAPSDTLDTPWAKGTIGTCEAAGFFLHIGATAVPFYTLFLSYYFLKRVKDKITPQEFARKYEFKIHAFIWLFAIIGGFVALATNDFNPALHGDICTVLDRPIRCNTDPDTYGTCIRGQNAPKDALLIIVFPLLLNFLMLIANLLRSTIHVHLQERLMRAHTRQVTTIDTTGRSGDTFRSKAAVFFCCNMSQHDQGNTSSAQTQSIAMQSLVQSSMYIASFFLVYSAIILIMVMSVAGISPPNWVIWDVSIFWPLGGFFNILIYTRPKVAAMRKTYPEYAHMSWFILCLVVVFSGGEVPATAGMHPVVITPWVDESRLSLEAQNEIWDKSGLSLDAIVEKGGEEDNGLTDSIFEIVRQRALADSSGADSFLRGFYNEFGEW